MERAAWLRERRRVGEERMDTLFAPIYDGHWGATIDPTHRRMLDRFLALCPPRARLLDAACGTGKYWPLLLGEGRSLLGVDQSAGMLDRARLKFPAVPTEQLGLQELAYEEAFDGIICIDALELLPPEDWPRALANFHRALRAGGPLCVTVELPEEDLPEVYRAAVAAGLPVVEGEYVKGGGYHYYPPIPQVRSWTDTAGLALLEEAEGDGYHHLLARKR